MVWCAGVGGCCRVSPLKKPKKIKGYPTNQQQKLAMAGSASQTSNMPLHRMKLFFGTTDSAIVRVVLDIPRGGRPPAFFLVNFNSK